MKKTSKETLSVILRVIIAVATAITAALSLNSCNVTRKMTTEQSYFQKGDTATSITTKTVESYTAKKMSNN